MYLTCKQSTTKLKLIDNLIISPDTSNLPMARSADLLDNRIRKLLNCSRD